jgi:hypothetical protein
MLWNQAGAPPQARALYMNDAWSLQGGAAAPPPELPPTAKTFYKRALPSPPAIAFSSPEGDCLSPRPNANDWQVPAADSASTGCQYHHLQEASACRIVGYHRSHVFAHSTGKRLFGEALAAGGMEGFFPLIEQFR